MTKVKFWNFENTGTDEVTLRIEGDIVDDDSAWIYEYFDDAHTTPSKFRDALSEHSGKTLNVIVDTYGGSVFAGASIYADLKSHNGEKIGIVNSKAMSAGTVILMACDEIRMSPAAQMMIHDPLTGMYGSLEDFKHTVTVLESIKASILNAYELKTGKSRKELSDLMTAETWMDAVKAVELGFADSVIDNDLQVENSAVKQRLQDIHDNEVAKIKQYFDNKKKETEKEKMALLIDLA